MFSVKWLQRDKEGEPVEVENSIFTDLDNVVSFCRETLSGMKMRHIARPPDGFVVVDSDGREVRRWFGSNSPDDAIPS
jgi:hypothetical protein